MSFILLCTLAIAGCGQASEQKTVSQLEAEIAQKQAEIERVKDTGGYPEVRLPAVCVRGVLYYNMSTSHGFDIQTPAIDKDTLLPERCGKSQ